MLSSLRTWERRLPAQEFVRVHRSAIIQFGAVAQKYVTSAFHARGDDLARLLELVRPRGDERLLDIFGRGNVYGELQRLLGPWSAYERARRVDSAPPDDGQDRLADELFSDAELGQDVDVKPALERNNNLRQPLGTQPLPGIKFRMLGC